MSELRTRDIRALGIRTRVIEAGAREASEAVVFFHGGPGNAEDWSQLQRAVSPMARTVAVDLPGFGEADKPARWWGYHGSGWGMFMTSVLNQLGLWRVHVVANDLGGDAAMIWAAAHPERVASAVVINTGVLIGYRWHLVAKLHRLPLIGWPAALVGRPGLRPVMGLYAPHLPADVVKRWARGYCWGTRRALLRFYRATPTSESGGLAGELAAIDCPALVIWGAENRFVPVAQAALQREAFPRARVEVLAASGHYSHLDSPDRVAALILPFLRQNLEPGITHAAS